MSKEKPWNNPQKQIKTNRSLIVRTLIDPEGVFATKAALFESVSERSNWKEVIRAAQTSVEEQRPEVEVMHESAKEFDFAFRRN
jgi:hypothetical protein